MLRRNEHGARQRFARHPSTASSTFKQEARLPAAGCGLAVISTLAGALCYVLRGESAFLAGLDMARGQFADVAVQLIFDLLIAASISALLPRDKVARWLGQASGFRGLLIATALGALMPA